MITHLFIDFDGVLTDNFVYVSDDNREMVRCSRSDGIGIAKIMAKGIEVVIISSEPNPVVQMRSEKLNVTGVCYGVEDKVQAMKGWCSDLSKAAFIGNDLNDYNAMSEVGFPIAVADARPELKEMAIYTTKLPGGYGAVREACGWLLIKMDRGEKSCLTS